jgi:hypothetical protein
MARTNTKKFIIIKDRVEIYKDFTINLLYTIQKYYIDRESLSEDEDIRNHFIWCFNRVCEEFKKEELDFSNNEDLREYFYLFYYNQFYTLDEETLGHDGSQEYFESFWNEIFSIKNQKNQNIINVLIELYGVFDKSINNEKNIFEFV